MPRGGGLPPGL